MTQGWSTFQDLLSLIDLCDFFLEEFVSSLAKRNDFLTLERPSYASVIKAEHR